MVEFQIRTQSMHQIAELGVAAHYRYKEGAPRAIRAPREARPVLRNPSGSRQLGSVEFLELLKTSLYQDEVFVFTPRGELRSLPRGATPIDFAYPVHTEVGNHCVGAKVNNGIVPLRYELRSGDKVQIITSPMGKPNRDWLKAVKSPGARSKIRHWLKVSEHADSVTLGKEMLEREIRASTSHASAVSYVGRPRARLRARRRGRLYAALGSGTLALAQVIQKWFPGGLGPVQRLKEASLDAVRAITGRPGHGVRIQGVDNLMVSFARCCQPVPGDSVVGIVTRGRGVTVHRTDVRIPSTTGSLPSGGCSSTGALRRRTRSR
jgi:GTP pyrophosphokinase